MSNPYRSDVAVDELATELGVELPALVRPDTERCLRRLATVAGVDLPSILFGSPAVCVARIKQGSGSQAPEWVLEGADFDIYFDNGQYYWGGAEKVVGDLTSILGASINFSPARDYNAAKIGTDGYTDGGMAFIGALRTAVQSGFTMRVEFDTAFSLELCEGTFSTDFVAGYGPGGETFTDNYDGSLSQPGEPPGTPGAHKFAFTLTGATAYGSIDDVRLEDGLSGTTFDPEMPVTPDDITFSIGGEGQVLRRFTVWTTPKNEADTQALTA